MVKVILAVLLLLGSYGGTLADTGGDSMGSKDSLDHYMELMDQRSEQGPVPIEEQLSVLRRLGLEIPEHVLQTCGLSENDGAGSEAGWPSELGYMPLLETIGWGDYDFDTSTWTPSSSQIYAFDCEVYNIDKMYQIYLQGLQSISQGELTFGDVTADYSKVDYETPGGTVEIRFKLNGKACRYEAQFMGDWLDLRIRDAVNHCLEELGIEKRFYATDGGQGEIIFFCTEDWAKQFEAATLCCMSDTV